MPRANPTPITAPTSVWVVETGSPVPLADDHRRCGGELGGESTARSELRDLAPDGRHHPIPERGQTRDDPEGAEQQYPCRNRRLVGNLARRHHADDRGHGPDGVGDVIGAVSKRHSGRGDDHEDTEHPLHVGMARLPPRERSDTSEAHPIDGHTTGERDGAGQQHRIQDCCRCAQIQTHVLQSLDERHDRGHEHRGEDVHRHVTARVSLRIVLVEDQPLHAQDQQIRDRSGDERSDDPACGDCRHVPPVDGLESERNHRESDNRSYYRVRGRHRPAESGRDRQPARSRQERRQHSDDEQVRIVLERFRVDDALADCRGDLAAGQICPEELEDARDQDGAAYGDGPCADRRPHRIRDIVGPDRPGHVETAADCSDQNDGEVRIHEFESSRRSGNWKARRRSLSNDSCAMRLGRLEPRVIMRPERPGT